jgi:hypothetical protein
MAIAFITVGPWEDQGMKHDSDSRDESRRKFLQDAGKLAVYTPPTMIALMQPSVNAVAASIKVKTKGNNGLGQRVDDAQPPGLVDKPERWNDRPSSMPGHPNNRKN